MIYLLRKIIQIKLPYIVLNKEYRGFIISIFFIFFLSFSSNAQDKKTKIPLVDILTQLEKNSNYQFTYATDIIEGILIELPPTSLTFKEKINYLERKTGLTFQFLDSNFIAIKASDEIFSICGYILDKEARTPLEAVTIVGVNEQVITDAVGYFKLKVSSMAESISIRYLGFQPISITANSFDNNECENIYLIPEIETLSEVILSNVFAKGIDKVADGSLNIDFSNFGILPGLIETDVLQTVQALPGIQSANEAISDINIRGGTNDQNLILWDGIKMYQSGHFFGLISIFNPLITNDALVIKNGTSVDYSDGVSGTIAMKTDAKINTEFNGSIASNFINGDAFADIPIGEKSSLQLSARKAISEFGKKSTPTYIKYFDRIEQDTEVANLDPADINFDFYDTSLRWLYNVTDKDFVRANFLYVNNDLTFLEKATLGQIEESKESGLEQNTLAAGLFYKRNWNNTFTTILQVTNSEYKLGALNVDILESQRLQQINKVEETSAKLNTWFKFNDQLSFLNGYQYVETLTKNLTDVDDPRFVRLAQEVIREHALYSQLNYNTDKTYVKLGARYSFIEKFNKHIIEPRLALNYKLSDALSLELLGEFKHQNTAQIINISNDFFGIEKRRWFLADNDKRPIIKSKQISLGVNYSDNGWLISVDSYFKNVDGISALSQSFLNQHAFIESMGSYDVYGIDFLINKRINKFSSWLSYSYTDNEYTFNDFEEVNFPNNLEISHAIAFGTSYTINDFKIAAGINWHTGIPTTKPIEGNEFLDGTINYELANSSNLDDYFRVDASATYKFKLTNKIKAQIGASVWNASNNNNRISSYYTPDDQGNVSQISKKALEITPNVSFRVLF